MCAKPTNGLLEPAHDFRREFGGFKNLDVGQRGHDGPDQLSA